MKRKWSILITVICLVAVVFTGCGEPASLDTAEVIRGDLTVTVPVSGNLETHTTWLSFGTSGTVKEILVSEGESAVKGQALAKLDAPSLEASVRMRQAGYEMAEYRLLQTIYPHYSYLRGSDLPGTWLALDEAQTKLEEVQELLEQGKIAEAQALLEQLGDSLDKVWDKLQVKVWELPLSVKLAELQVDEAEAALDMANAELAKAAITAPFDGVVANIEINEGEQLSVMAYSNPAICLTNSSEIKLSGLIDEIDISRVRVGQEAIITLDALPGEDLKGKVTFVSQAGTSQMGVVSYKTTITLENASEELRDGMSATADIIVEQHENVLLILNRAIMGSLANPYVEVVTDGETEQRAITMGLSDGEYTEVLSGMEEGEKVVLPPVSQIPFMFFGR